MSILERNKKDKWIFKRRILKEKKKRDEVGLFNLVNNYIGRLDVEPQR